MRAQALKNFDLLRFLQQILQGIDQQRHPTVFGNHGVDACLPLLRQNRSMGREKRTK
jgi:hypothetical protein